jgi:hypothetical protein
VQDSPDFPANPGRYRWAVPEMARSAFREGLLIWVEFAEQENVMPAGKHLPEVSKKEQRQYEHIKESAEKSGRYGSRARR